jgi:O-antigen ligase
LIAGVALRSSLPGGSERLVDSARPSRRGSVERLAVMTMAAAFVTQPAVTPTGPGNSSPVDVLTLISLIAAAIWATTSRLRLRAPYLLGAGLMILAGVVGGVNGPLPGTSAIAVIQDVVLITWCTAGVAVASTPHRLRLLAASWASSATVCALILVIGSLLHITAITGVVPREGNRVLFTFGDPNYAATYWVLSIFIVYAARVPQRRWLRCGGYIVLLWALALTESNGGAVELMSGCGLLILVAVYRKRGLVASAALLFAAAASVTIAVELVSVSSLQTWARQSGNALLVNSLGRSNDSSSQRSQLIAESFQLYSTDGILGSGPGTTKDLLTARSYAYAKEAHNDYLAALTERGPLGLIGILVLASSALWRTTRLLAPQAAIDLPRPAGLVAAAFAVALAASYYEILHFRFVWALLALIAVAAYQADDRSQVGPRGSTSGDEKVRP